MDASRTLHERLVSACDARRWVVAVILDIRNAFNFLSWEVIHKTLRRMSFPSYIRGILRSYLREASCTCAKMTRDPRNNRGDLWGTTGFRDRTAPLKHQLRRHIPECRGEQRLSVTRTIRSLWRRAILWMRWRSVRTLLSKRSWTPSDVWDSA